MKPPLLGIRHVAINATDLPIAERFWVDVMGFVVEWRPDADNVYLTSGRDNLAIHAAGHALPAGPGQLDHIGLAVSAPADVDAWAAHLRYLGVALDREPKQHRDGSRSLYFRDPGGVLVQIIHHAPISQ